MSRKIRIQVTPAITAGAYSVDDALGELLTLADAAQANGAGGTITSVMLTMKDGTDTPAIDVFFYVTAPAGTADNAALAPSDAEALNECGFVKIRSADYADALANNGRAFVETSIDFACDATIKDIYCQLRTREATTYGATDEVVLTVTIDRD